MIRQEDDFLMPGERLKSKNGYSVVIIEGLSPHGYRGVAHFRIGTDDYQEQKVIIGNNWKASYERIPIKKGTRNIPIELQLPEPPHVIRRGDLGVAYQKAKELIAEGMTQIEACSIAGIGVPSFKFHRQKEAAQVEAQKMESIEEEFNR